MMKLLALIAIALVAVFAVAQAPPSPFSASVTYDIGAKRSLAGIAYQPLPTQTSVFGLRGFNLTPQLIAGSQLDGSGAFGGVLSAKARFSDQANLVLGFGAIVGAGQKPRGLVLVGIEVKQ
jgi:hypothetical protein